MTYTEAELTIKSRMTKEQYDEFRQDYFADDTSLNDFEWATNWLKQHNIYEADLAEALYWTME